MISEFDTTNETPKYGNNLTKNSPNLVNSSHSSICSNTDSCSASSKQSFNDVKAFKTNLNGLIQPPGKNKILLMNSDSDLTNDEIQKLDSNCILNKPINGVVDELNKFNSYLTTSVVSDREESSLSIGDNIQNNSTLANEKIPSGKRDSKGDGIIGIASTEKTCYGELSENISINSLETSINLNKTDDSKKFNPSKNKSNIDSDKKEVANCTYGELLTNELNILDADMIHENCSDLNGAKQDSELFDNSKLNYSKSLSSKLLNTNELKGNHQSIMADSNTSSSNGNNNSSIPDAKLDIVNNKKNIANSQNESLVTETSINNKSSLLTQEPTLNECLESSNKQSDVKNNHSGIHVNGHLLSKDEKKVKSNTLASTVRTNNILNKESTFTNVSESATSPKVEVKDEIDKNYLTPNNRVRSKGLKRSRDDIEEEVKVKRLKTSKQEKIKNSPSQTGKDLSPKNKNDSSSKSLIKKCENSLENDGEMNPNKLYLGLLNDVMAEEKELVKEPEGVRVKLQRIKRKDLEDMIIDQLMNKILYDHELGYQKELCKRLEHTLEAANKRALRLTQEVESLRNITSKVASEHKRRKSFLVHPTKVKRSVGIQANKTYISQGFSAAFLPDSEVRFVVPTKYQKVKKGCEKASPSKGRSRSKAKSQIKEEKLEKDYLSIGKNLEQKLNTLREDLENNSIEENFTPPYSKKSKSNKKQAANGKQIKTEEAQNTNLNSPKTEEFELICPAPLPHISYSEEDIVVGRVPPNPTLKVHLRNKSIILSWNITTPYDETSILSYQLYSYEESKDLPSTDLWQKIGSVKALELPMACTLTQFKCGRTYHFAVRAMTKKGRLGPFSLPKSLRMPPK